MDAFTKSDDSDYEDVAVEFSTPPKEFSNGRYYTMNYYMDDYIISFYCSPIYCMTITEKETGSIIYCEYKDEETLEPDAHFSWEGFKVG